MKLLVFEKSVGAVIFRKREDEKKEFLLLHYPSGHWDFPKGHMEKGENEEETLRREVREETGIEKLQILPTFRRQLFYFYQAKGHEREKRLARGKGTNIFKRVIFYLAETDQQEVKISFEHVDHQWLSIEEALKKITFPAPRKILEKAQNFLD